jgi:hypothetical protein
MPMPMVLVKRAKSAVLAAAFAPVFVPAVALACPTSAAASGCGDRLSGYVVALAVGLVTGVGSVAFERIVRRR